jgi:cobalt-zinc-cadmium resistance protein CzcA
MTKERLVSELQEKFANEFPGIGFNFSQYIQDNVEEGLSGVKGANSVKIVGPDLLVLEKLAADVVTTMSKIQGVADLGIFRTLGQPNLNIQIDRVKAARYGLNTGDVNTVIQAAMGGTVATTVLEGDRQYGMSIRYASMGRVDMQNVRDLRIGYTMPGGNAGYVPLKDISDISLDTGATYIYHERNERFIPIKFSVRGRDLGSTVTEIQQRIGSQIKLPVGYRVLYAGEFEELQKAKERMVILIPMAIALILVLLYALFSSFAYSMLALGAVPFTVASGMLALYLSGQTISISAVIGFISLLGVSVMDGILILSYFKELRIAGQTAEDAICNAYIHRMRPLLMTALSACIGLLPAALSHGIGSQVQRPLATVVVGGMLLGPVFLLLVVPAMRLMVLRHLKTTKRRKGLGGDIHV